MVNLLVCVPSQTSSSTAGADCSPLGRIVASAAAVLLGWAFAICVEKDQSQNGDIMLLVVALIMEVRLDMRSFDFSWRLRLWGMVASESLQSN